MINPDMNAETIIFVHIFLIYKDKLSMIVFILSKLTFSYLQ